MKNLQINSTNKKILTGVALVPLVLMIVAAAGSYIMDNAQAKQVYINPVPAAQSDYDAWQKQRQIKDCEFTKALATAKLDADYHGVKQEGIDRNDLAAKRDANCADF